KLFHIRYTPSRSKNLQIRVLISIAHPGAECTCFSQVAGGGRGSLTFFPKGVFKIRQICYTKGERGGPRAAGSPRRFPRLPLRTGASPRHPPATREEGRIYESVYYRRRQRHRGGRGPDRKSTRLNSSHVSI